MKNNFVGSFQAEGQLCGARLSIELRILEREWEVVIHPLLESQLLSSKWGCLRKEKYFFLVEQNGTLQCSVPERGWYWVHPGLKDSRGWKMYPGLLTSEILLWLRTHWTETSWKQGHFRILQNCRIVQSKWPWTASTPAFCSKSDQPGTGPVCSGSVQWDFEKAQSWWFPNCPGALFQCFVILRGKKGLFSQEFPVPVWLLSHSPSSVTFSQVPQSCCCLQAKHPQFPSFLSHSLVGVCGKWGLLDKTALAKHGISSGIAVLSRLLFW